MKKQLTDLNRGDHFTRGGEEYIVLEHFDARHTLVITAGIVCEKAFDEENDNNFATSSLRAWLNGEYLNKIASVFGREAIIFYELDLTSDDGLHDYGICDVDVGLLTCDDYRKYRDILPPIGKWWWTATPYSTPSGCNENLVRNVSSVGSLSHDIACDGGYGVRPAFILKPEISVSDEPEDEKQDGETIWKDEAELYEAAVEKFGEEAQILMAIEEMAELTKALLKFLRNKNFGQGDRLDTLKAISEERADAYIALHQLAVIFGENSDASGNGLRASLRAHTPQASPSL